VHIGGVSLPKRGEDHCGDAWAAFRELDFTTIVVADGLGHGAFAATASALAVRVVGENAERSLDFIFDEAHAALRPTRGAAVGIARIHHAENRVDFCGVGNIAGVIIDEASRRVVSQGGIVGHEMRRVQLFSYPWSDRAVLVLSSDGISNSWNPTSYPGLLQRDPSLSAAVLFRDHCRASDDATIVIAKAL
jgi:serine/threonine protein phosphatase PrpC